MSLYPQLYPPAASNDHSSNSIMHVGEKLFKDALILEKQQNFAFCMSLFRKCIFICWQKQQRKEMRQRQSRESRMTRESFYRKRKTRRKKATCDAVGWKDMSRNISRKHKRRDGGWREREKGIKNSFACLWFSWFMTLPFPSYSSCDDPCTSSCLLLPNININILSFSLVLVIPSSTPPSLHLFFSSEKKCERHEWSHEEHAHG